MDPVMTNEAQATHKPAMPLHVVATMRALTEQLEQTTVTLAKTQAQLRVSDDARMDAQRRYVSTAKDVESLTARVAVAIGAEGAANAEAQRLAERVIELNANIDEALADAQRARRTRDEQAHEQRVLLDRLGELQAAYRKLKAKRGRRKESR